MMNTIGNVQRPGAFIGAVCCATVLVCAATPAFAQQFQIKLVGRWRIDWKRTADLGDQSAEAAKRAKDQAVTDIAYDFSKSGTLSLAVTANGAAIEVPQGAWKLVTEKSKDKRLELEFTFQEQSNRVAVDFLSDDEIKITAEEDRGGGLKIILKRVK